MKVKTTILTVLALLSSTATFANAPMPFNLRAGHEVVYIDWKRSATPTDFIKVSTPDGTKLGVVNALPGKTQQLKLPSDRNVTTVLVDYKGMTHNIPLDHGMGSGKNR